MQRIPESMKALNLRLMELKPEHVKLLRPVTSTEITEASTQNFHPDGLFSTEIFGRLGSDERYNRFSYIDVKLRILHPFLFTMISKVKALYGNIILGRSYAKWDEENKTFTQTNELDGNTGYAFFMQHFDDIEFTPKGETIRDFRLELINRYRHIGQYDKILVLPAGIRDAEIDINGQISYSEINKHYRTILSIVNTIPTRNNDPMYDKPRLSLHLAFSALFDLYMEMIAGKKKWIQGKLNYRSIHNGTRNVIVAMDTSVEELGDPSNIDLNTSFVSLFQAAKGLLPVVAFNLRTRILGKCFENTSKGSAMLINPETLKQERVDITGKDVEAWSTTSGMEKFIDDFGDVSIRNNYVTIAGYYPALVYIDDTSYKVLYDIDELPDSLSRDNVKPITRTELLYLSMAEKWSNYLVTVTRFPIIGDGSVYPSYFRVKTTEFAARKHPRDENWEINTDPSLTLMEYPRLRDVAEDDIQYVETMAPHISRHGGLGADHDGDMTSGNFSYDNAALEQTKQKMTKRSFYVDPGGRLRNSPIDFVAQLAIKNMG